MVTYHVDLNRVPFSCFYSKNEQYRILRSLIKFLLCITILPTEIKNKNMSFKSLTLINSNTATNYTYIKINFYTKLPINYNTNML